MKTSQVFSWPRPLCFTYFCGLNFVTHRRCAYASFHRPSFWIQPFPFDNDSICNHEFEWMSFSYDFKEGMKVFSSESLACPTVNDSFDNRLVHLRACNLVQEFQLYVPVEMSVLTVLLQGKFHRPFLCDALYSCPSPRRTVHHFLQPPVMNHESCTSYHSSAPSFVHEDSFCGRASAASR